MNFCVNGTLRGLFKMSEQSVARRQRVASWVRRRGIELGEIWSLSASFIYAWRSIDVYEGKSVAPLVTHFFVDLNSGVWFWLLLTNGCAVLFALVLGLFTGNTYRVRSVVSLFSSFAWILIAVAALQSHLPLSISIAYVVTCLVSWVTALILSQKAVYAETKSLLAASDAHAASDVHAVEAHADSSREGGRQCGHVPTI